MKRFRNREKRITIRLDDELGRRLAELSRTNGKNESQIVREALEQYLASPPDGVTCLDLARQLGIVGMIRGGPRDLSTNRKYFKGFGRGKGP